MLNNWGSDYKENDNSLMIPVDQKWPELHLICSSKPQIELLKCLKVLWNQLLNTFLKVWYARNID